MGIQETARALAERIRRSGRRNVWSNELRLHVQAREVDEDDRSLFAERLREELERLPGVSWARYNAYLAHVVIARDPELLSDERAISIIEAIEEDLCAGAGFAEPALRHAGDREPERRTWVEVAADGMSFALSTALRVSTAKEMPFDIDFAALAATVDGIPQIRKSVEASLSRKVADLSLELMKTAAQVAVRSETGPVTSVVSHVLRLREARARRLAWAEREPELCASAESHPSETRSRKKRPAPLRHGPLERYEEAAIPVSLGTFGASVFVTRDVEGSAPPIFAGLPRAARHGRSSFAAHLGFVLARRGVIVFDGDVLRRLDRIDTVALPEELVVRDPSGARRIIRRARESELAVRVFGPDVDAIEGLADDERVRAKKPSKAVRRMQRTGSGVLLIMSSPCDAFRAADIVLALETDPPPWGAHLIAKHGVEDALVFIDALAMARIASEQSVAIAAGEAATGLVISLAGLDRTTTRRVMDLANAASLIAMLNGVRLAQQVAAPIPLPPRDSTPYHSMDPELVLAQLESAPLGLSSQQASERARPAFERPSDAKRFGRALLEELSSPITPILGLGAGVSAAVGSVIDAGLIFGALGINGVVGAMQRFGARRAIDELETREERATKVWRDDELIELASGALVTGDVIELGAGEIVPADGRLIEAVGLEVDESSLTGESLPVAKSVDSVASEIIAERTSMLFAGTSIASGRARAIVVAVGSDTEAGRARASTEGKPKPSGVEARLEALTSITGPVAGLSALAVMGSGLVRKRAFGEVVTDAVGLGVAAVPEGLPILSTLAQLAAAKRLTRRGALVRNPRALEALGRVDVLCADKTGTLTEGRIRLAVLSDGARLAHVDDADDELREVLATALRATPMRSGASALPHPTDEALVRGAEDAGVTVELGLSEYARGPELPFEPGRGFHASIGARDGRRVLSVKGAPEVILPRCACTRDRKLKRRGVHALLDEAHAIAGQGYRVLAIAERDAAKLDGSLSDDDVGGLTFLGFVGLADPVRGSARDAVRKLASAGVRVVMLTGDHPSTAEAIAEELGLASSEIVTGPEVDALDDDALAERVEGCAVFARVTPAQKVRLVRVLSSRGKTVAMTGDGANDAAAIALADVGIAVGAHATSAARSVADLVVTDGRIETIVDAILEGRAMWASVRDAVSILVGGNFGEIGFALIPGLISGRSPLNARQLLLVNLVTDTLPSLAIAVSPPRREEAEKLLREGPEASLGRRLDRDLVTRAGITGGAAAASYWIARGMGAGPRRAGTVGLLTLTGAQLGQTLVAGGRDLGVIAASIGSIAALLTIVEVPVLSQFFGCTPLGPIALAQSLGISTLATGLAWAMPWLIEATEARLRARREKRGVPSEPLPSIVAPDGEVLGGWIVAA